MDKPRIFLGSSGLQKKLLQALTRGLEEVAHVEPWTTAFNPGTSTLARLFELAHEVDFAAFDSPGTTGRQAARPRQTGHAARQWVKSACSIASWQCAHPVRLSNADRSAGFAPARRAANASEMALARRAKASPGKLEAERSQCPGLARLDRRGDPGFARAGALAKLRRPQRKATAALPNAYSAILSAATPAAFGDIDLLRVPAAR